MARESLRDRQFTMYFRSADQKKKMRRIARSHRITFSHWIVLAIESFADKPQKGGLPSDTDADSNKLKALHSEHQKLFQRALELDQENKILKARIKAKDSSFHDLDYNVVALFRNNSDYVSAEKIKEAAGLRAQRLDPAFIKDRLKAIDYTLAQLESVGFIANHGGRGWKWIL